MPQAVDKVVILARGQGTRMRRSDPAAVLDARQAAVADSGVKAMIPVGRPFLDYALSALADAGCRAACVVIGPEHGAIRDYYAGARAPRRIRLSVAVQERPLGTADAVLAAEPFAATDRFLVVNADNYYPVAALKALRQLDGAGLAAFARESLVRDGNIPAERVARWPVVEVRGDGYLAALHEGRDGVASGPDTYVSMNSWTFTPAIFPACRAIRPAPNGELELTAAVRHAMAALGERFRVLTFRAPVLDLTSRGDIRGVAARLQDVEVRL